MNLLMRGRNALNTVLDRMPQTLGGRAAGGPMDMLGVANPRLYLPAVLGGHTPEQVLEPHHADVYTPAQKRAAYDLLPPAASTGGPGSGEEARVQRSFAALPQRRNSIAESALIHSTNPSGPPGPLTPVGFENLRHGGQIDQAGLMAMLPAGTPEIPWTPIVGGRTHENSIRTGRIFQPLMADGTLMNIRLHSNDPQQPPAQHAGAGPIVRVEHAHNALLDAQLTTFSATDLRPRVPPIDWGSGKKFPDQTHIPLV